MAAAKKPASANGANTKPEKANPGTAPEADAAKEGAANADELDTTNQGAGDPNAADQPPPAVKTVPGIRVASRVAGFRRCGRAWTIEPVVLALSELTDGQIKMLKEETKLTVADINIPVDE